MEGGNLSDRDILPDTVKPYNYALSIYNIELGSSWSYQGTVGITAKILRNTKMIIINSHLLNIYSSEVSTRQGETWQFSNILYDAPNQRATITFADEIPASDEVLLTIKFQGTINNDMAGFYRSKYKPIVTPAASVPKDDEFHYMYSTHFEASDARRAFPCFDEPNLKATFDVEIELPEDQVALSNMPVKGTKKKDGLQVVTFDRTPIMSTYLLAWAVGDFEYVEDFTKRKYKGKNLPVRVYTTRGLKELGKFALNCAHQTIDYFSGIFNYDYPLPKADLLAVHEFSHGAMENWGLVTYRTTGVLFDERSSAAKYKTRVTYLVAHELAHQWFGNLVTMDWWSELWLNEGFATWAGWLATNEFYPKWEVWPRFVTEGMQTAFKLDSLRSSHPIEVPVRDALDVSQIFDHISYLKGSSVIRMLAAHLGHETFLRGVSNYLKSHAFGNTTTNDLWSALTRDSGQDVNALMDPWIRKIGYPVLTIAEELDHVSVRQARYLSTGDVRPEDDGTTWWVPLRMKGKKGVEGVESNSLTTKKDKMRSVNEKFYKINVDNVGFYRTKYPPSRLASFGKQLERLTVSDKVGLIGDAGALAYSGDAKTPTLLRFLEEFSAEKNQIVWSQIISSLDTVKSIFSEVTLISEALRVFTLKLIDTAVRRIGWEFAPNEDYLTGQLRALLIDSAGLNGNRMVIAECKKRFQAYTRGENDAIHPSLRLAVFKIAVRYGGSAGYKAVKKEWSTAASLDGKEIALSSLGQIQDITLLPDFLNFIFTSTATQDLHIAAAALAENPKTRAGLWDYIKENWEIVRGKLGGKMAVLDRFLMSSLDEFTDLETERDIAEFFDGRDNRGYDRTLGVVSDIIKGRAAYRERERDSLLEWLELNEYA